MSQKWIHCNFAPPDAGNTAPDPCPQCGSEELCNCEAVRTDPDRYSKGHCFEEEG